MQPYEELEVRWSEFNGLDPKGMVACSSGTSALHLSLEAMRVPAGSRVATSDFNMVAVPRAIAMAGCTPEFVDCREDLLMDVDLLGRLDRDRVDAVIATHIYGRRVDMDAVVAWAGTDLRWTSFVVEDLAEAHGVRPHLETDAACWSFYRNKIVAGEEGGAVWFRNPEHAALARQLRSLGFTDAHDYTHVPRGHNYRMSNTHAELIIAPFWFRMPTVNTLPDYRRAVELRREIESWYDEYCPPEWRMPPRDAVWVYDVKLPTKLVTYCNDITDVQYGFPSYWQVDRLVGFLKDAGIQARHAFKPMSRQAEFKDCRRVIGLHRRGDVTVADLMSCRVLYLPVQPGVTTRDDCRRAFEVIRTAVGA